MHSAEKPELPVRTVLMNTKKQLAKEGQPMFDSEAFQISRAMGILQKPSCSIDPCFHSGKSTGRQEAGYLAEDKGREET